jgi:pyruvate/2-oxoacid:ferredoxin oxidoreductase beta subunit
VSALRLPVLLTAFETTGASLAGLRAALDVRGDGDVHVVGWAGDGGTYDIGIQALSGAAERDENVLYVCYDNEAYMNTGVQRSSATPPGAWTTTTPTGKTFEHHKKDLMAIVAAHGVPYAASGSVAFPDDLAAKFARARDTNGFRFLLVQSPCPTGWRCESKDTIRVARYGVTSGLFPVLEVEGGRNWRVNVEPTFEGLDEYLRLQRRFGHVDEDVRRQIRREIESKWTDLRARCTRPADPSLAEA